MWKMPVIAVLVLALAWGLFSWRWYTCGIKGVCEEARTTSSAASVESDIRSNTATPSAVEPDFESK